MTAAAAACRAAEQSKKKTFVRQRSMLAIPIQALTAGESQELSEARTSTAAQQNARKAVNKIFFVM